MSHLSKHAHSTEASCSLINMLDKVPLQNGAKNDFNQTKLFAC